MSMEEIFAKFEQPGAVVNNDNLNEYFQYAKERDGWSYNSALTLDKDVKLAKMFAYYSRSGNLNAPQNQSFKRMVDLVVVTYAGNPNKELLAEVVNLSKTQPEAFADIYITSCNSRGKNKLFYDIEQKCTESSLADNLYIVNALLDKEIAMPYSNEEKITKLPNDKAEIMARVFAVTQQGKSGTEMERFNAANLLDHLYRGGVLINFEAKNSAKYGITALQIRNRINTEIKDSQFSEINPEMLLVDEDNKLLKKMLDRGNYNKRKFHSTQIMKEQDINPKELLAYRRMRDMLVKIAQEQTEKYDSSRQGALKPTTQQFEEFMNENFSPEHIDSAGYGLKISIYTDAYLTAIYQDINNGNADKLSENALRTLLKADEDGYWLRKIAEKEPEKAQKIAADFKNRNYMSSRAKQVADYVINKEKMAIQEGYLGGVVGSRAISNAEKEEFLQAVEHHYADKMNTEGAEKKQKLEKYGILRAEQKSVGEERDKFSIQKDTMASLQEKYEKILENIKNPSQPPSGKEAGLTRENVEKLLAKFPNENICVEVPKQSAPLLFGGKEKVRLAALEQSISEFNKIVAQKSKIARDNNVDFAEFKGMMLDVNSVSCAEAGRQAADAKYIEIARKIHALNVSENRDKDFIKNTENKQKDVANKLESVRKHRADIKNKAKGVVNRQNDGVDPLAERQSNKTTDTEKLPRAQRKAIVRNKGVNNR